MKIDILLGILEKVLICRKTKLGYLKLALSVFSASLDKLIHLSTNHVFSIFYALCTRQDNGDGEEDAMDVLMEENVAHSPPPSLVPRLHAVLCNKLAHVNPLIPQPATDRFKEGE